MSITFQPRVWLNWLMPPLTLLEKRILEFSLNAADREYQLLLNEQIAEVNFVQRHVGGRDVYLYRIENGLLLCRHSKPLDVKNREICWVKLKIVDKQSKLTVDAEIWVLNGRVGNLKFSNNPVQLNARTCEFKIMYMTKFDLADQAVVYGFKQLPSDLRKSAESFDNEDSEISFVYPEDAYEIVLPHGQFIVIGEVADIGVLMVSADEESRQGHVYLGAYDGSVPELLGKDCAETVIRLKARNMGRGSN